MIKYKKGNLLDAQQGIIVHQTNCQGSMGAGVAKHIKNHYPEVFKQYFKLCQSTKEKETLMGRVQFIEQDEKLICNLFAQLHYAPKQLRHTSYDSLVEGFLTIKELYEGDIAMPLIGCGLGGGDWKIVSAIIESIFDDRDIYVYEL